MKASKYLFKATLTLLFASLFEVSTAQNVKLKGEILRNYDVLKEVTVSVFQNDSLISREMSNGKFKIELADDQDYKVVFTKDKYVDKVIHIKNAEGNGYKKSKDLRFKFDVELEKEREFRYVDITELDEPVALIFYNSDKGELDWDRDHTFQAHQQIAQLKDLNDDRRREKYRNF